MGTTARGIRYPDSTSHTRTWEHWQNMAADVDGLLGGRTPLYAQGKLSGGIQTLSATLVDCPGTFISVNVPTANAVGLVTFSADFQSTSGAGGGTGIVLPQVDGVDQTSPQVLYNAANTTAGGRVVAGNSFPWLFTAAGNHTLRLRAQMSGTLGMRLNGLHTQITVVVFPY